MVDVNLMSHFWVSSQKFYLINREMPLVRNIYSLNIKITLYSVISYIKLLCKQVCSLLFDYVFIVHILLLFYELLKRFISLLFFYHSFYNFVFNYK